MAGLQKVLLVEDDTFIRDMYMTVLTKAGYKVERAIDATEALNKAAAFGPEIILLDIMIPEKSGLELLKIFRSEPKYRSQHAKIIIVTNIAREESAEQARVNQADGYIVKADIMPKELIALLKQLDPPD